MTKLSIQFKKLRSEPLSKKINIAIISIFLISAVIFFIQWLYYYLTSGYGFEIGIFQRTKDILFSDFFHVNDMVYMNSPYYEDMSSYPPLVLLFAKLFEGMADYSNGYENMLEQPSAVFSLILFYFIFIVASILLLIKILKKHNFKAGGIAAIIIIFFICAPMIFEFERGNYIIYSLLFSLVFFAFYDDDNLILREFGFISLGIAVGIKLYPAMFALILLREKRFAEFFRCVAYSALLLILPFLFFTNGFSNISRFLYWLFGFSNKLTDYGYNYSIASFIEIVSTYFGHTLYYENHIIQGLQSALPVIMLIICALSALFVNRKWKVFALAAIIMIQYPNISFAYSLMMLLIPFIAFLCEKDKTKKDYFYSILFFFILTPVYMGFAIKENAITVNLLISSISMIVMEISFAVEAVKVIIGKIAALNKRIESAA